MSSSGALQFKPVSLFGGAIVADIPESWEDVSLIRQVPDTQEVFLDRDGFSSVVFDVLERVDQRQQQAPTDEDVDVDVEALKFHLYDLTEEETPTPTTTTTIHEISSNIKLEKMPKIKCLTLLATTTTTTSTSAAAAAPEITQTRPHKPEQEFVAIILVLVRLVEVETDFLVCINLPHISGQYVREEVDLAEGRLGSLIARGLEVREKVVGSLEVRDWGLFGEG